MGRTATGPPNPATGAVEFGVGRVELVGLRDEGFVEAEERNDADVVGPEGSTSELVNYRVRGNYMVVDRLFAAAEKAGVSLEEGRYLESRDPESGLDRLAIVLPVAGRYPALRAFLANALEGEPSLALEGLRLSRDGIGESEVQAEVRFVLFLGGRP